jgi:hypothetical protein
MEIECEVGPCEWDNILFWVCDINLQNYTPHANSETNRLNIATKILSLFMEILKLYIKFEVIAKLRFKHVVLGYDNLYFTRWDKSLDHTVNNILSSYAS